jgi:hypothetical protein
MCKKDDADDDALAMANIRCRQPEVKQNIKIMIHFKTFPVPPISDHEKAVDRHESDDRFGQQRRTSFRGIEREAANDEKQIESLIRFLFAS